MSSKFSAILDRLWREGREIGPRGMTTRELENCQFRLAPYDYYMTFPSRKLSLPYIRDELRWYLKGDRYDLSITEKAKIWQTAVTNGQLNSNYGHYLFRQGGVDYAVATLVRDPASRRAVVPILATEHLDIYSNDVPCTVSLGWRIRDDVFRCTVHMRSQDAIYGLGNDAPFFGLVHELVYWLLRAQGLPLEIGPITYFVESFHVYERHFDMVRRIIKDDEQQVEHAVPVLSGAEEAQALRRNEIDADFPFSAWLLGK